MSAPDNPAFRMSSTAAASPPNPPPTIYAFIDPLPPLLHGVSAAHRGAFAPVRSRETPVSAKSLVAPAPEPHAHPRRGSCSDKSSPATAPPVARKPSLFARAQRRLPSGRRPRLAPYSPD